jgi:hypothetical protein
MQGLEPARSQSSGDEAGIWFARLRARLIDPARHP